MDSLKGAGCTEYRESYGVLMQSKTYAASQKVRSKTRFLRREKQLGANLFHEFQITLIFYSWTGHCNKDKGGGWGQGTRGGGLFIRLVRQGCCEVTLRQGLRRHICKNLGKAHCRRGAAVQRPRGTERGWCASEQRRVAAGWGASGTR